MEPNPPQAGVGAQPPVSGAGTPHGDPEEVLEEELLLLLDELDVLLLELVDDVLEEVLDEEVEEELEEVELEALPLLLDVLPLLDEAEVLLDVVPLDVVPLDVVMPDVELPELLDVLVEPPLPSSTATLPPQARGTAADTAKSRGKRKSRMSPRYRERPPRGNRLCPTRIVRSHTGRVDLPHRAVHVAPAIGVGGHRRRLSRGLTARIQERSQARCRTLASARDGATPTEEVNWSSSTSLGSQPSLAPRGVDRPWASAS